MSDVAMQCAGTIGLRERTLPLQLQLLVSMDGRAMLDPGWIDDIVISQQFTVLSVTPPSGYSNRETPIVVRTNASLGAPRQMQLLCSVGGFVSIATTQDFINFACSVAVRDGYSGAASVTIR